MHSTVGDATADGGVHLRRRLESAGGCQNLLERAGPDRADLATTAGERKRVSALLASCNARGIHWKPEAEADTPHLREEISPERFRSSDTTVAHAHDVQELDLEGGSLVSDLGWHSVVQLKVIGETERLLIPILLTTHHP